MARKVKNLIRVEIARRAIGPGKLAEMVGVSRVTASRWVNNTQQPALEKLQEIADVLGVGICDLIEQLPVEAAKTPE